MTHTTVEKSALKKTPFYKFHVEAGARMVGFAGFDMPIQYSGMTAEHLAVRNNVGLFDLSHMGEFKVSGSDALAFLQKVTCNDCSALAVGQIQYSAMLYESGCFVDDLLVYHMEDSWFLVVNASNMEKDFAWLESQRFGDVTLENQSDDYCLLAIQGPNAQKVMAKVTDYDLDTVKYYHHALMTINGAPTLVSRTGYTGEDGFEIYLKPEQAVEAWELVTKAGKEHDMTLIGLGARDSLRMEMKMALYGNDIDDEHTALEAGLSWIVKFDKGDFNGKDALLKQKGAGVTRRLVCVVFSERCVPRHGYPLVDESGAEIGVVTSGMHSPSLGKPIALGYVAKGHTKSESYVGVKVRDKVIPGEVVKPPFITPKSNKPR